MEAKAKGSLPASRWSALTSSFNRPSLRTVFLLDGEGLLMEAATMRERSRALNLRGYLSTIHRQTWIIQQPDLLQHRRLVPIDMLMRDLSIEKMHDRHQWNF